MKTSIEPRGRVLGNNTRPRCFLPVVPAARAKELSSTASKHRSQVFCKPQSNVSERLTNAVTIPLGLVLILLAWRLDSRFTPPIRQNSIPINVRMKNMHLDAETFDTEIPLGKRPLVIGRGIEADIRIDDRWSSRRNCEIISGEEGLVVRDLGSANGTLVNGQHITKSRLLPGDKLTVGMTTFVVSLIPEQSDIHGRAVALVLSDSTAERLKSADQLTRSKPR